MSIKSSQVVTVFIVQQSICNHHTTTSYWSFFLLMIKKKIKNILSWAMHMPLVNKEGRVDDWNWKMISWSIDSQFCLIHHLLMVDVEFKFFEVLSCNSLGWLWHVINKVFGCFRLMPYDSPCDDEAQVKCPECLEVS